MEKKIVIAVAVVLLVIGSSFGLVAGEHGNRNPVVWIHTQRGVLYYLRSD